MYCYYVVVARGNREEEHMNKEMLQDKISQSGLKRYSIASEMGITPTSLANKVAGRTCFTLEEISKLANILNIGEDEFRDIFLSSVFAEGNKEATNESL